jgi:superoxide dismutase, Cu-Zn family
MRHMKQFAIVTVLLSAFAFAAGKSKPVTYEFKNGNGESIGTAKVTANGNASKIHLNVKNLAPGTHGIHVHAVAKCEGPDFKSAGPHADNALKKHGTENPEGPHAGDMKNFEVKKNGTSQAVVDSALKLDAFSSGSMSIVIHEKADDYKTDPAGNSGARIACALKK